MGRQTSGTPASPGTSRRAAQYGVTLPRRPSRDKIPVVMTKPVENVPQPTDVPVINNHEDTPTPDSPLVMLCECTNILEYFFSIPNIIGFYVQLRSLCENTALINIANVIHFNASSKVYNFYEDIIPTLSQLIRHEAKLNNALNLHVFTRDQHQCFTVSRMCLIN